MLRLSWCLRCPSPFQLAQCEMRAIEVIGMVLWPSGTKHQAVVWQDLSGREAWKRPIVEDVSILRLSVTAPLLMAIRLTILALRATAFFVGHDCRSFDENSVRPISQWKRACRLLVLFIFALGTAQTKTDPSLVYWTPA